LKTAAAALGFALALASAGCAGSLPTAGRVDPAGLSYIPASVAARELPALRLAADDRELWMSAIKRSMMKPGCCGACSRFGIEEATLAWKYVKASDPAARTQDETDAWLRHWRMLSNEFLEIDPGRFRILYGRWPEPRPR
jgi:hypothetical protein